MNWAMTLAITATGAAGWWLSMRSRSADQEAPSSTVPVMILLMASLMCVLAIGG